MNEYKITYTVNGSANCVYQVERTEVIDDDAVYSYKGR